LHGSYFYSKRYLIIAYLAITSETISLVLIYALKIEYPKKPCGCKVFSKPNVSSRFVLPRPSRSFWGKTWGKTA